MVQVVPHEQWTEYGIWGNPPPFTPGNAGIIVHHTVTRITSDPKADARTVERVTYNRGSFSAVPYSYLLHPSGMVFEGRGSNYRNGANRNDKGGSLGNHNTVSLSMIGDYRTDQITAKQNASFWQLVDELIETGAVQASAEVLPHSALAYTECPSAALGQLSRPARPIPTIEIEEDGMQTLVSKTNGEAWVVAGNKARPIQDVQQWLDTFDGPVISANNMEHVIADLYEIS